MPKWNTTTIKGDNSMAVSDPMPTDKRTRAYKDWLKREQYRQRMQVLEGSVSLRGFSYSDNQMYSDLSIELATLRANLLKKYPSTVKIIEGYSYDRNSGNYKFISKDSGERYLSGRGLNFVISAPTQFVNDFKNWAMRNHYSNYSSAQYPSFTARQYELFEEGKPVPTTIPGYQGKPQPVYTDGQLGSRMRQCNWEVVGNMAHTRAPDSQGYSRSSDNPKWDGAQDRVNRWQPLVSAPQSDRAYGGIGLFPPTFWPSDLGKMPTNKDTLLDGIMEWLMDLVDTFFSTPQFGTRPFAVGKWNEEDYRLSQRDPTRPQTPVGDMEDLLANPEASAWLENQKMGILISVLSEMCLANTLYDMVYDSELSKSNEWVVLLEQSRSGDEEVRNRVRNLVMPFTTWIDKAMAHETWYRCAYVTIDGERVEVTREMLLEQGLEIYEQVTDNASNTYRQTRPGPMDYNSLGLLTLAMNETVSFKNLISVDIFEQCLDSMTQIWQDSQKGLALELAKQNQSKIEAVDDQLKTLRDEVEKAEVKSYVLFTQTKGPRGGLYDGFSPQFSLQLNPAVDFTRIIVMTEKQQEELNQIYTMIYRKFVDASIPKEGNDVIFKLGNKTLSYDEALAIKNEDRSYGYQRKFPSLERALGGRSINETFTVKQENQLTSLIGGFYGMSQEDKQTLGKIVPTTINKVRTDREIAKLTQQLISAEHKVSKAKSQLSRAEQYFQTLANTITKEQRKVMTNKYLESVKRGHRKSGEPTRDLLTSLGIPIPPESMLKD